MNDLTTSLNDLEESIIENEEKYMLIKQDEQKTSEVTNNNWYSVKELCDVCGVAKSSWDRFNREVLSVSTDTQKDIQERPSRNGGNLYTDSILKQFQLWLKKNAMNAGGQKTESSIIKQDNQKDLFIGCVATKGTPAEKRSLAEYLMIMADQQEQLEIAANTNKQLEAENAQLVHALEYDKVKEWKPWSILKNQWKQQFEILRHHINYKELFDEVGLIKDKHYKKKVMGFNKFPTVLVSQEAEDLLFDWLDTNSY